MGRGDRYSARGRDGGRFQGHVTTTYINSDAQYQARLRLGVGVAVQREHYEKGFVQNYAGEFGHEVARCIESGYLHHYDEHGWAREHTLPPDLDEYDFGSDSAKMRYQQDCEERKELADFFNKR